MRRKSTPRSIKSTRERILKAAIGRFSRSSYEQTGLRDIAADAGVDVAYVHRCFGSKERLFTEALRAAAQITLPDPDGGFARPLAKHNLSLPPGNGIDIVVRSFSSPEASAVVRQFIQKDFIGPLADKFGQPMSARIGLVAAFLAGVTIFRKVLRIPLLLECERGELESLMTMAIEDMTRAPKRSKVSNSRKGFPDE
jgi:AcrR family transcriptional regulator